MKATVYLDFNRSDLSENTEGNGRVFPKAISWKIILAEPDSQKLLNLPGGFFSKDDQIFYSGIQREADAPWYSKKIVNKQQFTINELETLRKNLADIDAEKFFTKEGPYSLTEFLSIIIKEFLPERVSPKPTEFISMRERQFIKTGGGPDDVFITSIQNKIYPDDEGISKIKSVVYTSKQGGLYAAYLEDKLVLLSPESLNVIAEYDLPRPYYYSYSACFDEAGDNILCWENTSRSAELFNIESGTFNRVITESELPRSDGVSVNGLRILTSKNKNEFILYMDQDHYFEGRTEGDERNSYCLLRLNVTRKKIEVLYQSEAGEHFLKLDCNNDNAVLYYQYKNYFVELALQEQNEIFRVELNTRNKRIIFCNNDSKIAVLLGNVIHIYKKTSIQDTVETFEVPFVKHINSMKFINESVILFCQGKKAVLYDINRNVIIAKHSFYDYLKGVMTDEDTKLVLVSQRSIFSYKFRSGVPSLQDLCVNYLSRRGPAFFGSVSDAEVSKIVYSKPELAGLGDDHKFQLRRGHG